MTETTNYRLKKPAPEDFYDIGDQNANMDAIDAALKDHNDALERKAELGKTALCRRRSCPRFQADPGETADWPTGGTGASWPTTTPQTAEARRPGGTGGLERQGDAPRGPGKADAALEAARKELDGKADLVEGRIPVSQLPADVGLALGETEHGLPGRPGQGRLRPHFRRREARDGFGSARPGTGSWTPLKKGAANGVAPGGGRKVPDGYLNAQGGLVAQEAAPENQKLGWIDTGNGNILKFYDGEKWAAVNAVWG